MNHDTGFIHIILKREEIFYLICDLDLTHSEHRVYMCTCHARILNIEFTCCTCHESRLWDKSHLMRQIENYVFFS
jgi:hypothetical protein